MDGDNEVSLIEKNVVLFHLYPSLSYIYKFFQYRDEAINWFKDDNS